MMRERERETDTHKTERTEQQSTRNVMHTQTIEFASSTAQMCTYRTHSTHRYGFLTLTISFSLARLLGVSISSCLWLPSFDGPIFRPGGSERARARASGVSVVVCERKMHFCISNTILSVVLWRLVSNDISEAVCCSQHTQFFSSFFKNNKRRRHIQTVFPRIVCIIRFWISRRKHTHAACRVVFFYSYSLLDVSIR